MNSFIETQCRTMITTVSAFEQACQLAAMQNDGKISKDEQRALKKIKAASKAFKNSLSKI